MNNNAPIRTIAAICIGNAMEWYDFIIYNFMVLFIAQSFFPSDQPITSLLATLASSGIALVVRPLGGIFLAAWADKHGHHKALLLIFGLMALAILLITFSPSYAQIGLFATLLIVIARLLQGLATGGEFSIASSLLMTMAPANKKGLYTSLQMLGQLLALFFGSSICFILTLYFTNESLYHFAWRIPFAIGLLILPVGWVLRQQLQKQFDWKKEPSAKIDLFALINQQKMNLLLAFCLVWACTGSVYIVFSFMPTFSKVYLHLNLQESFFGPILGIVLCIFSIPFCGRLADKIGKKPILVTSLFIYLILIYPLMNWLEFAPSLMKLILVESFFGVLIGAYFGVLTAVVSEIFPANILSTCLAVSYNSAVLLVGGFAPFIITALIEHSHNRMVFTYYLILTVFISFIAALFYKENRIAATPE